MRGRSRRGEYAVPPDLILLGKRNKYWKWGARKVGDSLSCPSWYEIDELVFALSRDNGE